jgi:hypothetical protein
MWFLLAGFLLPTSQRRETDFCSIFRIRPVLLCVGIFIPLPLSSALVETKLQFEGLVLRFFFRSSRLVESNFSSFAWLGLFLDQQKKNDDD